jgi:O-succinylbenzoic acid--CoA ligase
MAERLLYKPWIETTAPVLLNPRLPAAERERIERALGGLNTAWPGIWVSTSGSTSAPGVSKWVALTRNALLASAKAVNEHLGAGEHDRWIHALPEFHVGGVGILVRAEISGAEVMDGYSDSGGWDARYFQRVCEQERGTLSALVPTQVHDLVQAGLRAPSSLRAIIIGGGALSDPLYQNALTLGWPLLPSYGLSECASQVATAGPDSSKLLLLSHIEAAIDGDSRLKIKSPALFEGYGLVTGESAQWLDPKVNGWFTTEDRVELRMNRSLKMLGRTADFVKIGGESVDLARLESLLAQITSHPEVSLVAVPDARLGHVVGLVAGLGAPDAGALQRSFNERVLPFERVKKVFTLDVPLPRSPLGKILRARLVELCS